MTGRTRFACAAMALFLIMVGIVLAIISNSTGDCWSNYTTESAAIMACEVHE